MNPYENDNPFGGTSPKLRGLSRLIKILAGLTFFAAILGFVGAIGIYIYFSQDLPQINTLKDYNPSIVSEVYSADGTKIGEFWKECRYLLPFNEIPKKIIEAFVASEDARFFEHRGVDFASIIRAFIKNVRAGRIVQGASTITQQIARSFFLSPERTFTRKIKEAILATQIEKNLNKEDILFLYLNQIFLGNRAYGIDAAARNYFQKNIEELNLAEISLIAGLPSAPTLYSPINNMTLAREQQASVLQRMVDEGYITEKEAQEALNTPLVIFKAGTDKDFNYKYAPYFTEQVRRIVIEKYGEDFLYKKGLRIYTTADLPMIQAAQRALKQGLEEVSKLRGFKKPLASLKPDESEAFIQKTHEEILDETGILYFPEDSRPKNLPTPVTEDRLYKAIITDIQDNLWHVMVGHVYGVIPQKDRRWIWQKLSKGDVIWVRKKGMYSPNVARFSLEKIPEIEGALYALEPDTGKVRVMVGGYDFKRSEFNRVLQAHRQPGSSFKPIIYAAALDKGYSPSTIVTDSPVTFQVGDNEYWTPKNYGGSFRGPITVKTALTHSVNVAAAKVLHDIGMDYALAYARKLGLQSEIYPYLSTALGASDTTLGEMTEAYAVFADEGRHHTPFLIRLIIDQEGSVIERFSASETISEKAEDNKENEPPENEKTTIPDNEEMNRELLEKGLAFIKEKNLNLTNDELKILYGARIPPHHVITPQTAFVMTSLLKNVVDHGTGYRAKALNRPAAGKTGTTNDETDALFIGYTPQLIAGVWVGFDELKKIGKGMTGGIIAAPIWLDFMQVALEKKPVKDFKVPEGVDVTQLETIAGGSAILEARKELPDVMSAGQQESSPDRSVDFLYEDTSEL
ncbi:MAG: hypothetical protein A3I75_03075 [Deltaproteobacteria bacterium RIFCSPLOWO2_02_FULL_50_16]|nr:MAG: hypothetical protein A3B79_01780 [Deltaproteobacteria bacterium RIFCSPHIGHO2_02_FULL_50_15]OGQ57714.1 MAG: hypothetical protein A3I75_03075 [Deltaproteobacteria bacterium RIFCSPLOWO2_02_FULL_50_16]OGQ65597.1 MAG: hypothetical protein A3F89_01055 [Deltaproteobacteria bacterium RIFCSPLOWO2_12_FULL_50_11]